MNLIAVVPVYNEESTVVSVLDGLIKHVKLVIVVNDASTDATANLLQRWQARCPVDAVVICLKTNRGVAQALKAGFEWVCQALAAGRLNEDDAVAVMDADGQHLASDIERLLAVYRSGHYDHVLGKRDLANYPGWKRWGNRFMSWWASLLGGFRFQDVECGFRLLRLKALADIMRYYEGSRYSNGQELAIISAVSGHRLHNSCSITVPFYRYSRGTTAWDGLNAACLGLKAAIRTRTSRRQLPAAARSTTVSAGDGT